MTMLPLGQAAKALDVSEDALYRARRAGLLESTRAPHPTASGKSRVSELVDIDAARRAVARMRGLPVEEPASLGDCTQLLAHKDAVVASRDREIATLERAHEREVSLLHQMVGDLRDEVAALRTDREWMRAQLDASIAELHRRTDALVSEMGGLRPIVPALEESQRALRELGAEVSTATERLSVVEVSAPSARGAAAPPP